MEWTATRSVKQRKVARKPRIIAASIESVYFFFKDAASCSHQLSCTVAGVGSESLLRNACLSVADHSRCPAGAGFWRISWAALPPVTLTRLWRNPSLAGDVGPCCLNDVLARSHHHCAFLVVLCITSTHRVHCRALGCVIARIDNVL